MARVKVLCEADYVYETEASVIETRLGNSTEVASSIEVPGQKYVYQAGKTYEFSTKKNANEFIKVHAARGGKFRLA